MDEFITALLLSLLPAAGYLIGGILSELFESTQMVLNLSLHGAVGVVLAVVAIELMPLALAAGSPSIIVLFFFFGGLSFIALDAGLRVVSSRYGISDEQVGPFVLFFGVSLELFNDGVMVGAGITIATALAFLLAISQLPGNIPESFATIIAFKRTGMDLKHRMMVSFAFIAPIVLGTSIGFFTMRGQSPLVKFSLLSFSAGVLTTLIVEEIIPLAHREKEARLAALIFICCFAGFAFLAVIFGQ